MLKRAKECTVLLDVKLFAANDINVLQSVVLRRLGFQIRKSVKSTDEPTVQRR